MVATNRYMGRLVHINIGNKASGEGCREPSKTTSWPQSLFQKTPSAHFDIRYAFGGEFRPPPVEGTGAKYSSPLRSGSIFIQNHENSLK